MNWPTSAEANAALRNVYSATAGGLAVAVGLGLTQGDATAIGNAVHAVGDGAALIIGGLSVLVPFITAGYAWVSSRPWARLKRMNDDPDVLKVIMKPGTPGAALADQIPGDKVAPAKV